MYPITDSNTLYCECCLVCVIVPHTPGHVSSAGWRGTSCAPLRSGWCCLLSTEGETHTIVMTALKLLHATIPMNCSGSVQNILAVSRYIIHVILYIQECLDLSWTISLSYTDIDDIAWLYCIWDLRRVLQIRHTISYLLERV